MKKIVVASSNKGKIKEIKEILTDYEIVTMREIGFVGEIKEDGKTFKENAFIKAKAVYDFCRLPSLADDSGICVEALNGEPGIFSARYSGGGDEDNNDLILKKLENKTNRKAKYVCAVVLYNGGEQYFAEAETAGEILKERLGSNGFGYDPLFFSTELNKGFGVATAEEKNSVSHRARALRKLAEIIKDKI